MKKNESHAQAKNFAMNRRGFLTTASVALAAGMMPLKGFSQQTKSAPPNPLSIKNNVYMALCR